ncbi:MAG: ATP-binding protein [Pseudomonadota bacterium]
MGISRSATPKTKRPSRSLESAVFYWALFTHAAFLACIGALLWHSDLSFLAVATLLPLLVMVGVSVPFYLRGLLRRHFFSLANVLESLRNGDFSMRVSANNPASAWSEVYREINGLADSLQQSRLTDLEADILLDKLLAEFDVPALVFDRNQILKNINQKGCELFAKSKEALLGLQVEQLHLGQLLAHDSGEVIEHWFPERGGRWELRKNFFIQQGQRFMLVLVNDLSRALREEERIAWQRLIRVLGHELNNSLASLTSVSETLLTHLENEKNEKWHESQMRGLSLIHQRSNSLLRFTESYTQLAKLPAPKKQPSDLSKLVQTATEMLPGQFEVRNTQSLMIDADPDQLQLLMINLLKNAVEASSESSPVEIGWNQFRQGVRLQIKDHGVGLPVSDNLFVPFYTTKENGSGIGLFLGRQIAESHGGTLKLVDRTDKQGCIAEVWLPSSTTS